MFSPSFDRWGFQVSRSHQYHVVRCSRCGAVWTEARGDAASHQCAVELLVRPEKRQDAAREARERVSRYHAQVIPFSYPDGSRGVFVKCAAPGEEGRILQAVGDTLEDAVTWSRDWLDGRCQAQEIGNVHLVGELRVPASGRQG